MATDQSIAIYRIFYLGLALVEYDMETVIFHYSLKEEYRFRRGKNCEWQILTWLSVLLAA